MTAGIVANLGRNVRTNARGLICNWVKPVSAD